LPDLPAETPPELAPDLPQDPASDASSEVDAFTLPDAAFFHVVRVHGDALKDAPYPEEYVTQYRTTDLLPDLDVRCLAATGAPSNQVLAGTASGLFVYDSATDRFVARPAFDGPGPVKDLAIGPQGTVVVAYADRVIFGAGVDSPNTTSLAGQGISSVALAGSGLVVGTGTGLFRSDFKTLTPDPWASGFAIRDLVPRTVDDAIVLATAQGLLVVGPGGIDGSVTAADGRLPDDDVRALALDGKTGQILVATATGLARLGATFEDSQIFLPAKGGLPTDRLTSAAFPGSDAMLLGHERGATFLATTPPHVDHYVSRRWLPDDAVTAVAAGPDGSRWIATPKGISRIRIRENSAGAKAAELQAELDAHYWRMDGFVSPGAYLDSADAPTKWSVDDSDNDGLWTQMMIGAWCYAYAITKDEKYYQAARKAMDVMFLQIDVPAVDFSAAGLGRGFVTRSLVRDDEGPVFESKKTQSNWHPVTYQGRKYYWKDDTSSDETAGHFFGYPLFYDLCAKDDAERAAVADHAGALAAYIRDHGFRLIDLDGNETSFGHWQPERIASAVDGLENCEAELTVCVESAYGGGWLNGLEILGHMLSAWHMTGDPKFYEAYDTLIRKYKYDRLVTFTENVLTVTNPRIANHSDHELAMLAYHTLIRYEPDDARRAVWIQSLVDFYTWELPERQPLWAAFVAMAVDGKAAVAEGVRSLREIPTDLRSWRVDNSHRKDALPNPPDRFDEPQFDTVFPYDELRAVWWNGNLYGVVEGGNGQGTEGPMAYLLAYWAQRYAGILL
jgi:hypothetical protein